MRKYLYTAFLLILFTACSESEPVVQQSTGEELMVGANYVTTVQVEKSRATRATTTFTKNFDLFLYQTAPTTPTDMTDSDIFDAKYETSKYAVYSSGGDKWYWDDRGGYDARVTLVGIYPKGAAQTSTEGAIDNINWTVRTDQSVAETNDEISTYEASDLLISGKIAGYKLDDQKGTGGGTVATLPFEHVLSKITVELVSGEGFTADDFKPTGVTLLNMKTTTTVSVDVANNAAVALTAPTGSAHIIPKASAPVTVSDVTTITYEAIVIPGQSFVQNDELVQFAITMDGSTNTYTAKIPDATFTFLKGYDHKFTITVSKTGTKVAATLANWITGENIADRTITIDSGSYGGSGGTGSAPVDNARLYVNLDGQSGVYKYGLSTSSWVASTPLYLDHITPAAGLYGYAVLIDKDTDASYDATNIYTSKSQEMSTYYSNLVFDTFIHPFSKITVTLQSDNSKSDYVDLSDAVGKEITVTLSTLKEYQSINLTSQVITYKSTDASPVPGTLDTSVSMHKRTCADVYVKPGTIAAEALLLTVNHVDGAVVNDYKMKNNAKDGDDNPIPFVFEAGKEYAITVTLKKTEITYSVTITGWTPGENTTGEGTI